MEHISAVKFCHGLWESYALSCDTKVSRSLKKKKIGLGSFKQSADSFHGVWNCIVIKLGLIQFIHVCTHLCKLYIALIYQGQWVQSRQNKASSKMSSHEHDLACGFMHLQHVLYTSILLVGSMKLCFLICKEVLAFFFKVLKVFLKERSGVHVNWWI